MNSRRSDIALALMRVMLGVVFIYHGAQKLFGAFDGPGLAGFEGYLTSLGVPFAALNAVLASSVEFFGGIALIAGLALRWVTIPMVVTMLVASFTAHSGFDVRSGGMEYALTLAVVLTGLGLLGPGRFTVAALFSSSSRTSHAQDAITA